MRLHFISLRKESSAFYVLLYFWFEYCGFCIDKFPELQELYDNCPSHSRVYSVYCGTEERCKQFASQYVEVLYGLEIGDEVVISDMGRYRDKEVLSIR